MSDANINVNIEEEAEPNGSKKKITYIFLIIAAIAAIGAGLWYWNLLRTTVSTDNAKVAGDLVDISPKVAGKLDKLMVKEQQQVKTGDILAVLDSTQYKINLNQASAALDLARANMVKLPDDVKSAQAGVDKAREGLDAAKSAANTAKITLADANRALKQVTTLFEQGAASQETLDSTTSKFNAAKAAADAADSNVMIAEAGLSDAQAKFDAVNKTSPSIYGAQLKQAQAAYDNAKYVVDNSVIKAPCDGTVVRITLQEGENVGAGQVLMTIADLDNTWVTANIDEGKIGRIKEGQKVTLSVDAYPGKKFEGEVLNVGGATQSQFALIPTENTSGNYTKVTQRLSVKISVIKDGIVLKPGMSAVITIHTAN
ncbi:MAG: HlyD family secretion protein [Candidatus Saccharibacteria bacterium]